MKKMLTMVAGAALLATVAIGGANAQGKANGPFADVPTDHWAYQSVEKLRDAGIVIGYPDGTYGGRRAMTRYEFATAIARLLANIPATPDLNGYAKKSDLGGIRGGAPVDLSGYAKKSDLDALRAEVGRRLTANEQTVAALRDLVNQFAPDLKRLGVDVAAANQRIDALDKRVTALEEEVRRVKITGEMNVVARADNSGNSNNVPIDKNGFKVGTLGNKSLWTNPEVYEDFLLNIAGRVSDTSQAVVSIDAGDYVAWLNHASIDGAVASDSVSGTKPAMAFNIYQAYLTTPISLGSFGASAEIGRVGVQFTPFTLKAVDPDAYTYNVQTDSGNVVTDGAKVDFAISGAKVSAFAGNADQGVYAITANPTVSRDGGFRPGAAGLGGSTFVANPVKNIAGARVTYGNPDSWTIGVTGVIGNSDFTVPNTQGGTINNFGVYGADGSVVLANGINLFGEFSIDTTGYNSQLGNVNSSNGNEAWYAGLGYSINNLSLKADYKDVYTNFAAPGFWGTVGSWTNPTNVMGPEVFATYAFTPTLSLNLEGDFYQGQYNAGTLSPLQKKDNLTRLAGGFKYGLTSDTSIDLGYEWVQWDLKNNHTAATGQTISSGKPVEQYITLGIGHELNKNSAVKLLYQILDYTDNGTGFGGYTTTTGTTKIGDTKGGVFVGQASVKF